MIYIKVYMFQSKVPLDSLCLRISLLNLGHPARLLAKVLL